MSRDPSFLPEDMRGGASEDAPRLASVVPTEHGERGFHVPGAAQPPAPKDAPVPAAPPPAVPASAGRRNGKQNGGTGANGKRNGKNGSSKSAFSTVPAVKGKTFRGITLIPSDLQGAEVTTAWVAGVAIAGVFLSFLLIGVPWFVLESQITEARSAVEALEARHERARQRAAIAEQDLASYRQTVARATVLRELLAQHRDWSAFFTLLEGRTLPNARYEGITADVSGSVMLPVSAPSVRAAAEQIRAWQETPGVSDIEMSGIASTADALGVVRGARFDMQFQVDPKVFIASPPDAKQ